MTISQMPVPDGLSNNPNKNMEKVLFVTIHNTGNYEATANAKAHAEYLYGGSNGTETSWHYTVDDKEIWQSFDDLRMCWHTGNTEGNESSIGVEICVNDKDAFATGCDNAAQLVADLISKHNLDVSKVVQHHYWSGKDCPYELRHGEWGITWNDFVNSVSNYFNQKKTKIAGDAIVSAMALAKFLIKKNRSPKISVSAEEIASTFIQEGKTEGIRGDLAFCQSLHETGFFEFGGDVLPAQNNFCGLGATGHVHGLWFGSVRDGVRAQIQHLKAYANKEPVCKKLVDPRFALVKRGSAPCWEDLDGKWAVPGIGYGENIIKMLEEAKKGGMEITIEQAIDILKNEGVINSPDYWLNNYKKLEFLEEFIINVAEKFQEKK